MCRYMKGQETEEIPQLSKKKYFKDNPGDRCQESGEHI